MEQMQARHSALADTLQDARVVVRPFSEADIIELHNRFLTPGFHSLKVKNIEEGRSLVYTLLASLNCHHDIACLSMDRQRLKAYVCDVYKALRQEGTIGESSLFDFFLDQFACDFLWIEMTPELMACSWFADFEHMLYDFHLNQNVPVIMLSYESGT